MRLRSLLTALPLLAATFAVAGSSPADADLKIDGTLHVRDVLVDDAHGRVFVAPGAGGGGLRVAAPDGDFLDSIGEVPGAHGLALTGDGSALIATQPALNQISVIDPDTLTVTDTISTGTLIPQDVAVVSGLYFFTERGGTSSTDIGVVDPTTDVVTADVRATHADSVNIASTSAQPGVLYVSTGDIWSFDVTISPETGVKLTTRSFNATPAFNLNISADGNYVLATGPAAGYVMQPSDLTIVRTVQLEQAAHSNVGIAMRADGTMAVAGGSRVTLFRPAEITPWRHYSWPGQPGKGDSAVLARTVLHFGATHLYTVTESTSVPNAWLREITPRDTSAVALGTDRATYGYGATAEVSAQLTSVGTNLEVSIYATPKGGSRQLVKTGIVDGAGQLNATFKVFRRTAFDVEYAGDAAADPASDLIRVKVHAKATIGLRGEIGRDGKWGLYRASGTVLTPGKVAPNHQGDCLFFVADYLYAGVWREYGNTGCVELDDRSRGTAKLPGKGLAGVRLRLRSVFGGDDVNLRDNSPWVYVRIIG